MIFVLLFAAAAAGRSFRQSVDLLLNDCRGSHPKGFPSYDEANRLLDSLVAYNPLFTERLLVGISYECRPIHAYWVSGARALKATPEPDIEGLQAAFVKNILEEEGDFLEMHCPQWLEKLEKPGDVKPYAVPDRGRVLITSLHHAREATSLTTGLFAYYHIVRDLQNWYQGNELSKSVRKVIPSFMIRTEILYMPFVNPDGYKAIERTGNIMIRKNQRPTCSKNLNSNHLQLNGVDLNRNYDSSWRQDHGKCDAEEYEGAKPFSEPETRAVRRVGKIFEPQLAINYHAYGDVWTRPWNCCKNRPLSDEASAVFGEIHKVLNITNFASSWELSGLGYTASGEADDYLMEAFGIYSMSPEVGPDTGGFYPSASEVRQLNRDNYIRTLNVLQFASTQLTVSLGSGGNISLTNHGLSRIGPLGVYLVSGAEAAPHRAANRDSLDLARHMKVYDSILLKAENRRLAQSTSVPAVSLEPRQTLSFAVDQQFMEDAKAVEVCVRFNDVAHLKRVGPKRAVLSPCQCGALNVGTISSSDEEPLHYESILPPDHPCLITQSSSR